MSRKRKRKGHPSKTAEVNRTQLDPWVQVAIREIIDILLWWVGRGGRL